VEDPLPRGIQAGLLVWYQPAPVYQWTVFQTHDFNIIQGGEQVYAVDYPL
jgi:hypothetical protein